MKKPSQIYQKTFIFIIIIALGANFFIHQKSLILFWLMGLAIGFVLYRSGICFSGAYSDIIMFRDFTMARAMLITIMVSLAGISFLQFYAFTNGNIIPGRFHSLGVHTIAGAFLFGLGMVLAGACGSGTLQRIGEGFVLYLFVLLGIVIGSVFGAVHFSWWTTEFASFKPVFLSHVFGYGWGGIISLTTLGIIFGLTYVAEKGIFLPQKGWGKWQKKG